MKASAFLPATDYWLLTTSLHSSFILPPSSLLLARIPLAVMLSALEVLDPRGLEHALSSACDDSELAARARDFADARRGHAANLAGQLRGVARADGEEQLEIFAAVERQRKRIRVERERKRVRPARARGFQKRVEGQERGFDARAHPALA